MSEIIIISNIDFKVINILYFFILTNLILINFHNEVILINHYLL